MDSLIFLLVFWDTLVVHCADAGVQQSLPLADGDRPRRDLQRAHLPRRGPVALQVHVLGGDLTVVRQLAQDALRRDEPALAVGDGHDEPDGSAKFIVSFLRNPKLTDAIHDLLRNRDGLMLGICNGFQALVKLGLIPFGEIRDTDGDCPTLTYADWARASEVRLRMTTVSAVMPARRQARTLSYSQLVPGNTGTTNPGHGRGLPHPDLQRHRAASVVHRADAGVQQSLPLADGGRPRRDLQCAHLPRRGP